MRIIISDKVFIIINDFIEIFNVLKKDIILFFSFFWILIILLFFYWKYIIFIYIVKMNSNIYLIINGRYIWKVFVFNVDLIEIFLCFI